MMSDAVKWVRDGHTARIVIDGDDLGIRFECPNTADYSTLAYADLPECRKSYNEDGQPCPEDHPLTFCNYAEWVGNQGMPIEFIDVQVTRSTDWTPPLGVFAIGWRWDGNDYVWAPSELIDRHPAVTAEVGER